MRNRLFEPAGRNKTAVPALREEDRTQVTDKAVDQETIERYLLGELPPEEQAALEARYLGDRELLDRIDAAEDDLIDDYVRRELPPAQRLRFETHFLDEKRLERVRMAESLLKATAPRVVQRRQAWVLPLAAVLFGAALLAIVWLLVQNRGLGARIETLQAELDQAQARQTELARKTVPPPEATTAPTPQPLAPLPVAAIVLAPGLTRDAGDVAMLAVEPKTRTVRIEARLEARAPRYEASLQRAGEPPVWTASGLVAQTVDGDRRLVLHFPREQFTAGDYILTVTAPDFIADYAFTVKLP